MSNCTHAMSKLYTFCEKTSNVQRKKILVMGILNVTPDSFSDGGKWNQIDEARRHAYEMVAAGADIIDVGAESTRPGFTAITAEEEMERLELILKEIIG